MNNFSSYLATGRAAPPGPGSGSRNRLTVCPQYYSADGVTTLLVTDLTARGEALCCFVLLLEVFLTTE